jgi:hypothetical protein
MTAKKKPAKKAKSSKKVTGKASKKPLESLSQVHGKEEKFQSTTLEQVWGDSGHTKYGTTDSNEYIRQLDDMNKSDLQGHARIIGFVPIDDRVTLTNKLISEFNKYVSGFKKPLQQPHPGSPLSSKAKKIMDEGR